MSETKSQPVSEVRCPYCGAENTEYKFDESNDVEMGGIDDGTPIYKCLPCLSYFPQDSEEQEDDR